MTQIAWADPNAGKDATPNNPVRKNQALGKQSSEADRSFQPGDINALLEAALAVSDTLEKERTLQELGRGIGRNYPELAVRFGADLTNPREREIFLGGIAEAWAATSPDLAITWTQALDGDRLREYLYAQIALVMAGTSPEQAASLARDRIPLGSLQDSTLLSVITQWVPPAPTAALRWIERQNGLINQDLLLRSAVGQWSSRDAQSVVNWLNEMPHHEIYPLALVAYAETVGARDPHLGLELAPLIPESISKVNFLQNTLRRWMTIDLAASQQWLRAAGRSENGHLQKTQTSL